MKLLVAAAALLLTPIQTVPLPRATGIAAAPNGKMLVARSGVGSLGTLTVYRRESNGKLTKLQCVTRNARVCTNGRGLETPSALAFSPDGTNLYVTGKDILGNDYSAVSVDSLPSVPTSSKNALSDVVDATFWSPYN